MNPDKEDYRIYNSRNLITKFEMEPITRSIKSTTVEI